MTGSAASARHGEGPLAIIAGGGSLPSTVAAAARAQGRRVVLFPIRGSAEPDRLGDVPHHWIGAAQFGRFLRLAASEGCRDVVMIGSVLRPTITTHLPDLYTLRLVPRFLKLFRGGDDRLLSGIGAILEERGFRLLGAHEVAPEILMPEGALARGRPSAQDLADIARGLELLSAMGRFDVGQAVVVANGRVLAVEAAEGTDGMLDHVALLRREGRIRVHSGMGVLVKAPKPGQNLRIDLPSIGPQTVERAAAAGLAGIAVAAGRAIVAEPERLTLAADRTGLFVMGVRDEGVAG